LRRTASGFGIMKGLCREGSLPRRTREGEIGARVKEVLP
jgi:hypothetical protein